MITLNHLLLYENKFHNDRFRLTYVDGYSLNEKATYAAIWQKKSVQGLLARHGLTAAQYQNEATKYARDGYKLMHISGYAVNRKAYYAAIWKKADNSKQITRHGLSSQQYQNEVNTHWKNGYRILQVDSYDVNGKVYYAAIFEKVPGRFSARHQLTPINYQLQVDNHYYHGGRMTGTRARLKLKENGIYFVYLVNKYDGENDPNGEFNTALEDGIANIKFWPDIDLF